MKIYCLISSLRLGGAERQMVGLACSLASGGHNVSIVTYRSGDFYEKELEGSGVEHIRIPEGNDLSIVRTLSDMVARDGIQLIISFLTGANIKACLLKRLFSGVKVIVSERNCNSMMLPHDIFRFILYRRYADAVVCNCYAQEAFIKRSFPSLTGRLSVVPNFVDLNNFSPNDTKHREDIKRIVVTARVCRRKNAVGLIEAAAILSRKRNDFRIAWYGLLSDTRYLRKCRRLISRYSLEDVFRFHYASDDIRGIYCISDIFCLPSFYEGTSNSLAEALSCGLPAVCSRISDNPLYVENGVNGFLFNPKDADDISSSLEQALDLGSSQMEIFGQNSRKKALEYFNSERMHSDYESIIAALLQ